MLSDSPYISFLLPLPQITTNLVASNNTHLYSYSCGGHKSAIIFTGLKSRRWQDWLLLEALGKDLCCCLFFLLVVAVLLGWWPLSPSSKYITLEKEQDPLVLPPPCPQPAFCLCKNFSQRISLIREVRKCRNKGKQSNKT